MASAVTLVEGGGVGVFAGGDLDGDGRMDVALARNTGGVLVFYAARCGGLIPTFLETGKRMLRLPLQRRVTLRIIGHFTED